MLSKYITGSLFLGLAAAAPAAKCVSDSNAWHLTHITKTENGSATSINFDFTDDNKGLGLKTHCTSVISSPDASYACKNNQVNFSFDLKANKITVSRGYHDPCAGSPDYVQAFGDATLQLFKTALDTQQNAADTDVAITSKTL